MNKQAGISLVQLLISTMLGLLLSAALLNVLYATLLSSRLKLAVETIQENSALAAYFLIKDLNGIAFSSCFGGSLSVVNITSRGAVAQQLRVSPYPQGVENQYKGSDSMSFITVLTVSSELIDDMATVHASVDLDAESKVNKLQEIFITDCKNADLFMVSSIWRNRLKHDLTKNVDANLSVSYPRGALVYPLTLVSYKLAKGASGQTGLYRKVNTRRYQELIPNVHQLRIFYGLRHSLSAQVTYQRAASLVDLADLVSMRIELVYRSPKPILQHKMYYQNSAGQRVQAADKHFYKYQQLLIALRNSANAQG